MPVPHLMQLWTSPSVCDIHPRITVCRLSEITLNLGSPTGPLTQLSHGAGTKGPSACRGSR